MGTYLASFQIDENNPVPFGSTLFGICTTSSNNPTKTVNLTNFDRVVDGITVAIKFVEGNINSENVTLRVGTARTYPIQGDCRCAPNEVVAFTFEGNNTINENNWCWRPHTSGLSETIKNFVIDSINSSTDTPDVLIIKGTIGTNGRYNALPSSGYEIGWTYIVSSAGTYANKYCEEGALIIATSNAQSDQQNINPAHWTVVTTKNYYAGTGLELDNQTNTFSVNFGNTSNTVASGDHNHDSAYSTINHAHGIILNNGTVSNANANALLRVTNSTISLGASFGNDTSKFLSNDGTWQQAIVSINGQTPDTNGIVTITASSLGLRNPMQFIGMVANDSQVTPSDGSTQIPSINGIANYEPTAGDIIIDTNEYREYVYTIAGTWESLGPDGNFKILQTQVIKPENETNKWVSSIGQNENGEITVSYSTLVTSGTWTGVASNATKLETPREIYVDLTRTRATVENEKIKFDGTRDIAIQISGVLPVSHGGTGMTSFSTGDGVIFSENDAFVSKPYIDIAFLNNYPIPASLNNESAYLITERAIYYALPTINGYHDYNSLTNYYAPITPGEQYQILISNTHTYIDNGQVVQTTTPIWAPHAYITSSTLLNGQMITSLVLGGQTTNTNNETVNIKGNIQLYSQTGYTHTIQSDNTTEDVIHHLLGSTGYLIQTLSAAAVGSNDNQGIYQPIYIDTDGYATAITFTSNRLYYSSDNTTQEPSRHYIDNNHLGINCISWPLLNNEPITDALYVNGSTNLDGALNVDGTTSITGAVTIDGVTSIIDDTTAASNRTGALVVTGGIYIDDNLYVRQDSTLIGSVGIGHAPESGQNAHLFYVNGTSHLEGNTTIDGIVRITDETDAASTNSGALIVSGGVGISKKLYVNDATRINSTLRVTGPVGINTDPDSTSLLHYHILTVKGSIALVNNNTVAHLDINTSNQNDIIDFFPEQDVIGHIGSIVNQWYDGYFSNILTVGSYSSNTFASGVSLENQGIVTVQNVTNNITKTIELETSTTGQITIISSTPTILLTSLINNNENNWIITNNSGTFSLNNQTSNDSITLEGNNYGFRLISRLYINSNSAITNGDLLDLYVNGETELYNKVGIGIEPDNSYQLKIKGSTMIVDDTEAAFIDIANKTVINNGNSVEVNTINFYPNTNNSGFLGLPEDNSGIAHRWAGIYIGTADTYGDAYTPIYWNDGVPTYTPVVQKYNFTFVSSGSIEITLDNTYAAYAMVDSIVVTDGISYLIDEITWENFNDNGTIKIILSTVINNSNGQQVSGYILVSTGYESVTTYTNNNDNND